MKLILVMGIVFLVDLLLLCTIARMGKRKGKTVRYLVSAFFGTCFAAATLLPGAEILSWWGIHILSLLLMALMAYGLKRWPVPSSLILNSQV